ncbi:MAG: hypothetical protein JWL90_3252 [Chthoniobacteraceae bacterium]|nr:hypothetical protein [Chthoniobacteraceae bacterium]
MLPSRVLRFLPFFLLGASAPGVPLEFNRDIRPILSENCFYCHGQDPKHREAKLRLDLSEEATRDLGGYSAIVPGKPDASELIARITSEDREEQMPPPKSNRHLTAEQKELLKRWIAQGSNYEKHWAFIPPQRAPLPQNRDAAWPRNAVDRFVLARLETEGLSPSIEAQPEAWLRRASFDLIGLPPTLQELDQFKGEAAAHGEAAYTAAADRLLASVHFGERLAIDWLDAARYADTHGFNNDAARSMWRWRDWVIEAFNSNKPYNEFLTEQLAGDLLPNPTLEQRVATGFGRNHVINSEGGIIEEEYRVEYVADRVRTTSMAWLGLTTECARCHDHKFDPITQRDYYQLFAFFNSVPEHGEDGRVANAVPMMAAPTHAQSEEAARAKLELAGLDAKLEERRSSWQWHAEDRAVIEQEIAKAAGLEKELIFHASCDEAEPQKEAWSFPNAKPALLPGIKGQAWSGDGTAPLARVEGKQIKLDGANGATVSLWVQPAPDIARDVALLSNQSYGGVPEGSEYGKGQEIRLVDGEIELRINDRFPAYAIRVFSEGARIAAGQWRHVTVSYIKNAKAAGVRMFVDGCELATRIVADDLPGGPSGAAYLLGADEGKDSARFRGRLDELRVHSRALSRDEIKTLFRADALPYALTQVDVPNTLSWLREVILEGDAAWHQIAAQRDDLWERSLAQRRALPTAMVMADLAEPRPGFILTRGNYNMHGDAVEPGVPEKWLAPWPVGAPRNRLGLARWFTQPDHPLTARVVVNRYWAQLFGTGLVKTLEDFGSQGEWPSHPELLDWLAREFVDGGWNVKALFKTLVLSSTYRQSSALTPALVARDPENRLLAHGPRFRLPAELIRDQALAISGLLRPQVGGPSVFPYQPETLYKGTVVGADYPGTKWIESKGDDLYRRSLYTFWKRTVPHPVMLTFDAPDREFCIARRSRTNTPLQALVLLNEPAYLESARQLAARMLREGGSENPGRVTFAFRLATGRLPTPAETSVLSTALLHFMEDFGSDPTGASALLKPGASPLDPALPPVELAAATVVASMILNLDETITKN